MCDFEVYRLYIRNQGGVRRMSVTFIQTAFYFSACFFFNLDYNGKLIDLPVRRAPSALFHIHKLTHVHDWRESLWLTGRESKPLPLATEIHQSGSCVNKAFTFFNILNWKANECDVHGSAWLRLQPDGFITLFKNKTKQINHTECGVRSDLNDLVYLFSY